jgi:hypothetical protein
VPDDTDILLTHGPPRGHLDGFKRSGCTFLAKEVARVRPRLVVFGHIHIGYGQEVRRFDAVGRAYEGIMGGWKGWGALLAMSVRALWAKVMATLFPVYSAQRHRVPVTKFINAAVVGGSENGAGKTPVVAYL